jgi:hypothetical protein
MSITKTLLMFALGFALLGEPASAQVRSGVITGSVMEQSGAAVPSGEVTIANSGTNVSYKTRTTAILNSAEYNVNFSGGLGSMNLSNNPGAGLTPGYGNSSFGTVGLGTFDPRPITMHLRLQF